MSQQKVFTTLSYKEAEKKVDLWLASNPNVQIEQMDQSEHGTEMDRDYRFTLTISYSGHEGAATEENAAVTQV